MTLRSTTGLLILFLAPCLGLASLSCSAMAGVFCHCPKTVFCRPKPPCIKYKCVCPKPICPCEGLENFGYYQTCWHPWPFPPNYSHCPCPPIMATEPIAPSSAPAQLEQLPAPQKETPKETTSEPSLQ